MATPSSILAWRIPWTEEPGGLHSIGSMSLWLQSIGWTLCIHKKSDTSYRHSRHHVSLHREGLMLSIFLFLGSSGLSGEGNEGFRETLLDCRTKLYPPVNFTSMKLIFWFPFCEALVSHFSVLYWTCREWEEWLSFFTASTISLSYTQWFSPYYHLPLSRCMCIFICKALLGFQFLVFFS